MKKYLAQGVTKCDMLNICDFLSLFCPQMRSRDSGGDKKIDGVP